jgi:hypothetical protein
MAVSTGPSLPPAAPRAVQRPPSSQDPRALTSASTGRDSPLGHPRLVGRAVPLVLGSRGERVVAAAAKRSRCLGSLCGPAEPLSQQPLDRAGRQPHSGQPLDHLRDLRGAPHLTVEAVGGWPPQQRLLDPRQLMVGDRWLSGPSVLQRRRAAGARADRSLTGDAELPGDRGRRVAFLAQRGHALPRVWPVTRC